MTVLSVPVFAGGVVLAGAPDVQQTSELAACSGYDIGPRGQLILTSDLTDFALTTGGAGGANNLDPLYGIEASAHPSAPLLVFVGDTEGDTLIGTLFSDGSGDNGHTLGASVASGWIATFAEFPMVLGGKQVRVILVNIGARSFNDPSTGYGLWVVAYNPSIPSYSILNIANYDALGTGPNGEFPGGTNALQLKPRGVVVYNSHAFLWGSLIGDVPPSLALTVVDAPNVLMFSNIGNPLKYGNDPDAQGIEDGTTAESDRIFEQSDNIVIGGGGEAIRCCYVYRGKLWVGTNRDLHYIEGFGRESFQTNGTIKIAGARNTIGPGAMIEGPDELLYGVSSEGLWQTNGGEVTPLGDVLINFEQKSPGWWDLIWSDASRTLADYPGRTNQDLVWMSVDRDMKQVIVWIPFCSIENGYGFGNDTVAIKFHTQTGGFTQQQFPGKILTAGAQLMREAITPAANFVAVPSDGANNVKRYRYKPTQTTAPALPATMPDVTFGEYSPFGPNGVGVLAKQYLTIAWAAGALPLSWALTQVVDGQTMDTVNLTIAAAAPGTPENGDLWLDTSGTDPNLGNGTAGTLVVANPADYIIRRWIAAWNKWVQVPGGGQQGTRATIPIEFSPRRGSRFKVRMLATTITGRFQIENFSDKPAEVREAA